MFVNGVVTDRYNNYSIAETYCPRQHALEHERRQHYIRPIVSSLKGSIMALLV